MTLRQLGQPRLPHGAERYVGASVREALKQRLVDDYFDGQSRAWTEIYERRDVVGVIHQYRLGLALSWLDRLGLPPGSPVLEVGCGAGLASVALAQRRLQVSATDTSDKMLALTRRRADQAGVAQRMYIGEADVHDLQFDDSTFNAVIALGVLSWLHSPQRAIREITRVLKPGGHLIATAGNRARLNWLLDPRYTPVLTPLRSLLKELLRLLGRPWPPSREIASNQFGSRGLRELLTAPGLEMRTARTIGFGPFTFLGREFLPGRIGVRLNRGLQWLTDRNVPVLRSLGTQHIALARKGAS